MILAREETSRRVGDSVGTAVGVSSSWKHPVGPGVLVAGGGRVAGGRGGRVAGGRGGRVAGGRGGSGADHGRGGVAHFSITSRCRAVISSSKA